jgi:hypothetical protein
METDAPSPASKRPRPFLLILLGVLVAVFLLMRLGGPAEPRTPPSNPARAQQRGAAGDAHVDPSELDVHLEALAVERPEPGDAERNPFRFQPKAPPPPPAPPPSSAFKPPPVDQGPVMPPPPPAPPPITVKFVGTFDLPDGSKLAVITDCTSGHKTVQVRQGEVVLGQYRLVKIGETSIVIEHLDGTGRTTLAKNGQECIWK